MTVTEPNPPPEGEPSPPDPNAITVPTTPPEPPARPQRGAEPPQAFTAEDIERIRNEERARFQREVERADQLDAELVRFRQAEDERIKTEAKAAKDAEKAKKKSEEEEMDLRQLMERRDQEWEQRLAEERSAREAALAVLDQERRHSSLTTYMAQRMAIDAEEIAPELRDLVSGNSEEEIDASIAILKQKSAAILGNYQQVIRGQQATRPTVGVTAPPVGPMETSQTTRTYTADELKAMTPEEYAAERDNLLRAASQGRRQ